MDKSTREEIFIQGSFVSEGIAIGIPFFFKPIQEVVPEFSISANEVDAEVARYRKALFSSKEDLKTIQQDLVMEVGAGEAVHTIETHIEMLDDPMITTHMEGQIRKQLLNTESVFKSVIKDYEDRFNERTQDSFFHKRLIDVQDVTDRILGKLLQKQQAQLSVIPPGSIVFTKEIAPSYLAAAHASQIGGVVTERSGGNSHAALILRSKGMPSVVVKDIASLEELEIECVIIDGFKGTVILNPSAETLKMYYEKQKQLATRYQKFLEEDHLKGETIDGMDIKLFVNVGNPSDLDTFTYQHDGVGLFRTEYLFLQSQGGYPTETYQEQAYREVIEKVGNNPIVIRVFDLGGDKYPGLFVESQKEPNPILGNRGIRFLLKNRDLFKSQLRAIFKAAGEADIRILLPMISDINELLISKAIIEEVREDLMALGYHVPNLPLGCMIEVPSAVILCDVFIKHCDFLSMGTNDLVQYTLGVDRTNPQMSELYYPAHPSVLRMIKMIVIEAKRRQKSLTICGEIASNDLFLPILLGLGLERFSMAPPYIPYAKEVIRKWTIVEAYELAEEVLQLSDPKEISELLTRRQKR